LGKICRKFIRLQVRATHGVSAAKQNLGDGRKAGAADPYKVDVHIRAQVDF
jgi:hypothetical protein